jgi:phosphoribosylamine--glycine ligase
MKVLIVGGGGREHALAWKIRKSRFVSKVYCAPGNAGIATVAKCKKIQATDIDGLLAFVKRKNIELTIVGPEQPLAMGIVDRFEEEGLKIFGPSKEAAKIEASKVFAKRLMEKYRIPTARSQSFTDLGEARKYIKETGGPLVVKVDGLAAGKGAFPCDDELQALEAIDFIEKGLFEKSGSRILIEEYLNGEEASILAFSDGRHIIPLESAQDHKRAFDNDKGPNTGGMGAYSPAPVVTDDIASRVYDEILVPTIRGMASEGTPYKGILYAGLMITEEGPKVIEFNCRFGDPEAQAVIPRMATDLVRPMMACCDGTLDKVKFRWSKNKCVCVVVASGGYPGSYGKGHEIKGLNKIENMDGIITFHAGTVRDEAGNLITNGGRVLGICGLGPSIKDSIKTTYKAVRKVKFEDSFHRKDIGRKATYHLDGM